MYNNVDALDDDDDDDMHFITVFYFNNNKLATYVDDMLSLGVKI